MYPGSFNPPTIAHLAIAKLALRECNLNSVTFAVSQRALAKEAVDDADRPTMADRLHVLGDAVADDEQLDVLVTNKQLIVDIAEDFDVVILGADKWLQIQDPHFYGNDPTMRDQALLRLPEVALVPRPPIDTGRTPTLPIGRELAAQLESVSSSRARAGEPALMVDAARAFDAATGAWTDPERYERHLAGR